MRRTASIVFALVLVAGACGGNDTSSDPTTASTVASTTGPTTATTAAATTAAPTTEAPPSEMSAAEAFIAASADNVGEFRGQWDNATFGSSGDLYINVLEANPGTVNNVLIQVDVDGSAFGAGDPDLFVVEIWVENGELVVGSSTFLGSDAVFEADIDAGTFTMVSTPPLLGGTMTLEIEGTMGPDGFGGTYVIPGLADGTWGAEPA